MSTFNPPSNILNALATKSPSSYVLFFIGLSNFTAYRLESTTLVKKASFMAVSTMFITYGILLWVSGRYSNKDDGLTSPSEGFGYQMENTVTLTDDEEDPTLRPTRDNIVNSLIIFSLYANPLLRSEPCTGSSVMLNLTIHSFCIVSSGPLLNGLVVDIPRLWPRRTGGRWCRGRR